MENLTTSVIAAVTAIDAALDAIDAAPGRIAAAAHRIATADTSDWARQIERFTRIAAVVVAFIWTIGSILAETLYDLGGQLRRAIDARNDELAAIWVRLWVGAPAPQPAAITEPTPEPELISAPLAALALPLLPAAAPFALLAPAATPARRARSTTKATAAPAAAPRPARRARRRHQPALA